MPKESQKQKSQSQKLKARRIKQQKYRSFRLSKPLKQPKPRLTGGFRLFIGSLKVLLKNKRVFGGTILIALLLNILLVRGFASTANLTDLKSLLDELFSGRLGQLTSAATLFTVLIQGAGVTTTAIAAVYQSFLLVILSLVYIWFLRNTMARKPAKLRIRDGFYKGMYPLITFMGVLAVIGLQLFPLAIANFLYGTVIGGGLAVTSAERVIWIILIMLLIILTIYMVSSSVFALYVVTLPDVTPMQALRSARDLVRFRRWSIIRKVLVLPFCMLSIGALIIIPLIMVAPPVAEWTFYLLTTMSLLVFHSYFYNLYRELL